MFINFYCYLGRFGGFCFEKFVSRGLFLFFFVVLVVGRVVRVVGRYSRLWSMSGTCIIRRGWLVTG